MMVMFDLPVIEPDERKAASAFRNFLLDQGFEMAQFSVYMRYTSGKEAVVAMSRKIELSLPPNGKVDILQFTDKQYEHIISFRRGERGTSRRNPDQFVLF